MPRYSNFRLLAYRTIFLCVCLLLNACGSNDSNSATKTNDIRGNAVKGVISNGIVKAFDLSAEDRTLLSETRTDEQGNFSLPSFPQNNHAVILLELSADTQTLMRCDLISGCIENATGKLIEFGQTLQLPSHFKILGIASQNPITKKQQAFLSPLSHIIVSTAQKLPAGLTPQNINIASEWLASTFELKTPPLNIETPDLTKLLKLSALTDQQLKQGILSAVFYSNTLSESWSLGSADLDSLSLESIFSQASELADQLALRLTDLDNIYASSLASISAQTQQQYDILVSSPLVIQSQPNSTTLEEGKPLSLRVQASGDGPLSYQWQKDDIDIPGANTLNYNITNTRVQDSGTYSVIVRNTTSLISSLHALVIINKVLSPVSIIQQPATANVTAGDSVNLSVVVTGDGPINYQWQKDGSLIPGATFSTLTINASTKADEGSYRVIVNNNVNQISSDFVNVWVNTPIASVEIIQQPQQQMVTEGSSARFSVLATGGGFIRYQWRKNGTAINNAFGSTYNIAATTLSDIGDYDVTVTNSQGSRLSITAPLSVISKSVPVSITQQPQSISVSTGGQATLFVQALGDGPLSYQWLLNGALIPGANKSSYTISNASANSEGIYTVKVQNNSSSELSLAALITIKPLPSILLSWTIPTQREDASVLTPSEISGYLIQYGVSQPNFNNNISINNGLSTSYTLKNIQVGMLYLRMATIDASGHQGKFSSTINVNIQ